MLYVTRSNRTERLLDALAALVAQPLPDPFLSETIVVQGKGMERWLSMQLARRMGVWANAAFPFPRTLLNEILAAELGEERARAAAFEPEALTWRIAALLPGLAAHPRFGPVRAYLERDDPGELRRLRLAAEIASVFDRYVLYRPELVTAWDHGDDAGVEDWQPPLWRAVVGDTAPAHLAARVSAWIEAAAPGTVDREDLPTRVSIFGISTLAPLYLDAFTALAGRIDVHLFLLAPSREFLAGVMSAKQEVKARQGTSARKGQLSLFPAAGGAEKDPPGDPGRASPADPDAPPLDRGHALVGSLGKLARDFQSLLEDRTYDERDEVFFVDPAPDPANASLLHVVQSDILALRDRRAGNPDAAPLRRPNLDDSIQIHSCHSPMREVEVLHDRLLRLFDEDPTLEPRDVVVLAPAIDDYAPYIDAVFRSGRGPTAIPFFVADRGPRVAERVADAFFRILDLLPGRFAAPGIFDVLSMDVVRGRFGIAADELDRVRTWIDDAAIRWGADALHRAEAGQREIHENTWAFGLDRLALGLALPAGRDDLFCGTAPAADVEGPESDLLGRFADFYATLASFRELASTPRPVERWEQDLGRLLGALVAADAATADQHRRIRRGFEALSARAEAAGFTDAVSLEAFRRELENEIGERAAAHGFLSGGVTFCAMVPMRSIPFRVVAILGMNETSFPRTARPPRFDRTLVERRRGDRSRRDDDRYLFLEALLSARERLLLTYVGQSIQDNTILPPSVVVSELLDVLADSFVLERDAEAGPLERRERLAARILVRHPLQPFSTEYFREDTDARLFSYSRDAFEAARARLAAADTPPPFLSGAIAAPERPDALDLADLERFLEHPSRWFCQRRLNLFLGRDAGLLEEAEPLVPGALHRWQIGEILLGRLVAGARRDDVLAVVRARGMLPPGEIGGTVWDAIAPEAADLADAVRTHAAAAPRSPLPFTLDVGGLRLTGILRDLRPERQLDWSFSRLGGRRELRLWLRHLVLQVLAGEPGAGALPRETVLVGRPAGRERAIVARWGPVANAREILEDLVGLWDGSRSAPPPFFPEASRACARKLLDGRAPSSALGAARSVFVKGDRQTGLYGEGVDPYVVRLFDESALDGDGPSGFAETAVRVYQPLLAFREDAS